MVCLRMPILAAWEWNRLDKGMHYEYLDELFLSLSRYEMRCTTEEEREIAWDKGK